MAYGRGDMAVGDACGLADLEREARTEQNSNILPEVQALRGGV